jgi:hypothetical protein
MRPEKPSPPVPASAAEEEAFTSGMRIFGGVAWGTLTTLGITIIGILLPQVPRPWLWGALPLWAILIGLGVALQWQIARGKCPKCGYALSVPPTGKRCPQCRTYLKAMNRQIIRMG